MPPLLCFQVARRALDNNRQHGLVQQDLGFGRFVKEEEDEEEEEEEEDEVVFSVEMAGRRTDGQRARMKRAPLPQTFKATYPR